MDPPSISGTIQSASTLSSSKNSSVKSITSSNREIDLTKDNAVSPIDLECHIQCERITKILNDAIYKCKLAICLADLVQEYRLLDSVLSPVHMDDLIFIFEQYDNPMFSASLLNMAVMDDIKAGDLSIKNRLNPELGHLIYIMNSYPQLRPTIDEMIAKMRHSIENQSGEVKLMPPGFEFLLVMEHFQELMIRQMQTTAAEELSAKINTKKLEASNEHLIERIAECSKTLKEETESFEQTIVLKSEIIAKLEHELLLLNQGATAKLKKKILDSERQMVLATRSHAVKNEMLKEEEMETREAYEQLLRQHLIEEKNQRTRRLKVETQLLSWLQKYDLEMNDKQLELDEYTRNHDEEEKKCEELERKIEEQNIEYIPLMAEREAEYQQEMMEKMNKFMADHAARVIQTAWRDVLANRAEKRKLRKLMKKAKASEVPVDLVKGKKKK